MDADAGRWLKVRQKNCAECLEDREVLYRCRYASLDWQFLCESCLLKVKGECSESYVYGGTWKRKKT
ncbi:MAG: hypothetical protein CMP97_00545 [Gammaproteobacteria bacterium]|nr:hypothetical protein [Gammaproteobacteria bacterium]